MKDHGNGVQASEPDGMSRRTMLAGAAGLTGVAALAGARWAVPAQAATPAPGPRAGLGPGATVTVYDLSLDGVGTTHLRSVTGGGGFADVTDTDGQKSLGPVHYEDLAVQTGPPSAVVTPWILAFLANAPEARTGVIQGLSGDKTVLSTLAFTDALITEVGFPALDVDSKDPALLSLDFASANNKFTRGGEPRGGKEKQKAPWLASNFKLAIDGLDTSKVNKVDGITITQAYKEPLVLPSLQFTMAETSSDSWFAWFESFVVQGNTDDERGGSLSYLAPNGATLLTLSLEHLGPVRFNVDRPGGASESIRRVTFELYVEHIGAKFG